MNRVLKTNCTLLLHESLFSLNIGFAIAYSLFAYEGSGSRAIHASKPVRDFLDAFGALLFRIAPLGTDQPQSVLHQHFRIWEVGFIFVMLVIGAILFLLLRQLARTAAGQMILASLSGIAALVAVPAFWLYIVHATWSIYDAGTFWRTYGYASVLEITAAGGILYLIRRRAVTWGVLVFALHYIFWVLVMGERSGVPVVVSIPLSLVFPCAGFAWLSYVRALQTQQIM